MQPERAPSRPEKSSPQRHLPRRALLRLAGGAMVTGGVVTAMASPAEAESGTTRRERELRELVTRAFDTINLAIETGEVDIVDEFISPHYRDNMVDPPVEIREALKQFFLDVRAAFTGFHYEVLDVLVDGDKATVRFRRRGTHDRGEFLGIAPDGRELSIQAIEIFRIVGGKFVDRWGTEDRLDMYQQLGVHFKELDELQGK